MMSQSVRTYWRSVIVIVQEPRLDARGRSVIARRAFGLATATAVALWYVLSSVNKLGAILVPACLVSTLVLSIILCNRIRARRRWQAAWENYAMVDLSRTSVESID
jgi:hypothetical protein